MNQTIRYFLSIALVFLLTTAILPAYGQTLQALEETAIETSLPRFEKVYVDPSSVLLTPEGIFFLAQDGQLQHARLVAVDTQGMYVIMDSYQCRVCGRRYLNNLCVNPRCPNYGKPCE